MGLSALSTYSAGRRRSRPDESPFISALTGAVRSAIFAGCLYTTSGQVGAVDKVYIKDSPYDKIDIKEHGGHTYDDEF